MQPSTVMSSQLKAIEAPKPRIGTIKEKPKERALTPLTVNEESMGMSKYGSGMNFHQINVVTYTCDFGNIIVGKAATKSYRLTNCGKLPISFNFDKKLLNFAGLTIEPDKAQKIMPNQSILFKAVMTTRKTSKYGRQSYKIPVDIKNGPQYTIDFTANLTIPEISMSTDTVDFGAVCVNTRKTIKIRIENKKDVICEWNFHNKSEQSPLSMTASTGNQSQTTANSSKSRDDSDKFQVWPHSGVLIPANPEDLNSGVFIPGQCQTVDIMFTPSADKPYMQKLVFKCN